MNIKRSVRGAARASRTIARNAATRLAHGGNFSDEDTKRFPVELPVWRPQNGPVTTLMRWTMTEWCNFNCPYCYQVHDRRAAVGGGLTNHCFDNFPVEKWMHQFEHHFSKKKLALILTGGEPMLDSKNMNVFLNFLGAAPWCTSIRIDTNASWVPSKFKDVDRRKITLNCSFHPTQIKEEIYFRNLAAIKDAGFAIGFVNYVYSRDQKAEFHRIRDRVESLGLLVNASPEFDERKTFTEEEVDEIKGDIIESDYLHRLSIVSPKGRTCLYPTLSYEMRQSGYLRVGCMPSMSGSFFDPALPFFGNRSATCPYTVCSCLDKYSFLEGFGRNDTTDPFNIYCGKLRDLSVARRANESASG